MLLTIVALGYQSCWYEGHVTDDDKIGDKMARILNVSADYELVYFLPVGIAESDPMPSRKFWRKGLGLILFLRLNDSFSFVGLIVRKDSKHRIVLAAIPIYV